MKQKEELIILHLNIFFYEKYITLAQRKKVLSNVVLYLKTKKPLN